MHTSILKLILYCETFLRIFVGIYNFCLLGIYELYMLHDPCINRIYTIMVPKNAHKCNKISFLLK